MSLNQIGLLPSISRKVRAQLGIDPPDEVYTHEEILNGECHLFGNSVAVAIHPPDATLQSTIIKKPKNKEGPQG